MKILEFGKRYKWGALLLVAVLSACTSMAVGTAPPMVGADSLVVLPIANYTETPDAGHRAQSIAQSILQQRGFRTLQEYPRSGDADLLAGNQSDQAKKQAIDWARSVGARYALTGSVQEWRYKVGLDGEPAVGLTFNLLDVDSGAIIWSATGSRSGWSRSSLAGVGQTLIQQLLAPLVVQKG
ncbi:penicillin-binding protein activator LpoB [Pusillimonas sp. ANT_WB101]|uniref:penicillin-binding protein activator LpoB n=1 Tax=Pusillimonas sp. ANT_WB101 TaxID=2597356 RepID=UPI0011EBBD43|nr:penicillin-binding protein activator LpoB [Pusillimonas sp. ANT_WB101]KAA0911092.1 penicillin-binding protein activator LpoB [Pusillimonas sp. ANT_WB101]